mmetsp:Transcript_17539/g.50007  ORF Transcript_17539/g.50007 Transcript_17539/m.50007 type:complete len:362 (-) Transcript_17539:1983-3068(-)
MAAWGPHWVGHDITRDVYAAPHPAHRSRDRMGTACAERHGRQGDGERRRSRRWRRHDDVVDMVDTEVFGRAALDLHGPEGAVPRDADTRQLPPEQVRSQVPRPGQGRRRGRLEHGGERDGRPRRLAGGAPGPGRRGPADLRAGLRRAEDARAPGGARLGGPLAARGGGLRPRPRRRGPRGGPPHRAAGGGALGRLQGGPRPPPRDGRGGGEPGAQRAGHRRPRGLRHLEAGPPHHHARHGHHGHALHAHRALRPARLHGPLLRPPALGGAVPRVRLVRQRHRRLAAGGHHPARHAPLADRLKRDLGCPGRGPVRGRRQRDGQHHQTQRVDLFLLHKVFGSVVAACCSCRHLHDRHDERPDW